MAQIVAVVRSVSEGVCGFEGALRTFEGLADRLQEQEALRMTHNELEELLHTEGTELLRQLMQAHLDARQGGKVKGGRVEGSDGVTRSNVRELPRNLETRFGTVVVHRVGYSAPGAESVVPMDSTLNLPDEKYSFTVQRMVAEEAAKGSFDNVVDEYKNYPAHH